MRAMIKSEYLSVNPYMDPVNAAGNDITDHTEMTVSEMGFLCGLIRDKKPGKIVELGVAAGGTTAVIIKCIEKLGITPKMYSVDLFESYYRGNGQQTGYIAKEDIERYQISVNHEFKLGRYLPEVLPDIGGNIDFLVMDTVHRLPGELLDFIAVLPYLKNGAVVVLHDVSLSHHNSSGYPYCLATEILFLALSGQKYLQNETEYPNIAAIQINEDTRKNVIDVFSALTVTWDYCPDDKERDIYRRWYEAHYSEELLRMFDQAVSMNMNTLKLVIRKRCMKALELITGSILSRYSHVLMYGAGKRGKSFYKAVSSVCDTKGYEYVVTRNTDNTESYLRYDSVVYDRSDTIIVLTANSDELKDMLENSEWNDLIIPEDVWADIEAAFG